MIEKLLLVGGTNLYSTRLIEILRRQNVNFQIISPRELSDKKYLEADARFVLISFGNFASSVFQHARRYRGGLYIEELCIEMGCQAQVMDFPSMDQFEYIKDEFKKLKKYLSDSTSRKIFEKILSYWKHGDRDILNYFKNFEQNIYFNEEFLEKRCDHVYFDVGAFTGDSLLLFRRNFPDYSSSVLFEPNRSLKPRKGLLTGKDIYLNVACSDEEASGYLSLKGINSTLSKTSKINSIEVTLTTLDRVSKSMNIIPTFIKIDAEGYDIKVLRGAMGLCRTAKPVIALSIYHNPLHIIEGLHLLICAGYKGIYLRKYCDYNAETVLYGIHDRGRHH